MDLLCYLSCFYFTSYLSYFYNFFRFKWDSHFKDGFANKKPWMMRLVVTFHKGTQVLNLIKSTHRLTV